jgi:cytochrome c biogenesis protein CcdA
MDEERQRRLDRVGHALRIELAIGFLAPVVLVFVYVGAPGTIGGGSMHPGWVTLLPWIGGAGVVFGLAWLVRFSRPDPEGGEVDWRYRDI